MIRLALLWHMHQPYYEDAVTGEFALPWVRMHALKDYRGMVDVLEEFPGVRATFNLVPSLLAQLLDYAGGRARDRRWNAARMPVDQLAPGDRALLVARGFDASFHRMIASSPRYLELWSSRAEHGAWTNQDLRDLQVWQTLAWFDPDRRQRDPVLRALVERDRGYSEADKHDLFEAEHGWLASTIPTYRAAAERGQVELSVSPYFHPILPLLCDTDTHLAAHPQASPPARPFRYPEDAREQIRRAVRFHTGLFGNAPAGMWPPEGAVSDAVVPLAADEGLGWMASGEDVLARSLGQPLPRDGDGLSLRPDLLYRPYEVSVGGRTMRVVFRDHDLSDRIGFTYQSWDAEHAAADFLSRVREAGGRFAERTGGEDALVAVILDGENAWEHYAGGGRPFLRALYGRLQEAPDIRTVTMAEATAGRAWPLAHLFPGSWIAGDLAIWAGHLEDQRAWSQLAEARAAWAAALDAPAAMREAAYDALLVAEGSDWFWWYGDDHSSPDDDLFDQLFRHQLQQVYRRLDLPVPADLLASNIAGASSAESHGAMSPADGR